MKINYYNMLKYEENEDIEKKNSKICICIKSFFIFLFFFIIGILVLFLFPGVLESVCNEINICPIKTDCQVGFWGEKCYPCLECGLNGVCNDTKLGNGLCVCNRGWSGKYCNKCDNNFYKKNNNCTLCKKCYNGYCDKDGGECICYEPFSGENCSQCMNNNYGINCSYTCTCENGICDRGKYGTGKCVKNSCDKGWTGEKCDKCDIFYKKKNNNCIKITNLTKICSDPSIGFSIIENKYGDCLECKKDHYGKVCSENGICDGMGTTKGTGNCNCFTNYTGDICQYYNFHIVNNSLCNNNCNYGLCVKKNLNDSSAFCKCNQGYTGDNCNICSFGYYLFNNKCYKCLKNHQLKNNWGPYCEKCNCNNGTCNSGYRGTGECNCNLGWDGINCNKCQKIILVKNVINVLIVILVNVMIL